MALVRADLARMVDHTLLRPEATPADVAALCTEANALGVHSVCVSPSFLPLAAGLLAEGIATGTVVGFPSGKHHTRVKADEAARALADGADEVDMVIDVGAVRAGMWRSVHRELDAVRRATEGAVLKVILETAVLTDDEIVRTCVMAHEAGAEFVKTSTGFHPAGGATTRAVSLMANTVGVSLGIKASGGIRSAEAALAMVAAGATRLGLSATRAVLDDLAPPEPVEEVAQASPHATASAPPVPGPTPGPLTVDDAP